MASTGTVYCYIIDTNDLDEDTRSKLGIQDQYCIYVGMTTRSLATRDLEHRNGGTCKRLDPLCKTLPKESVTLIELASGIESKEDSLALETMLIQTCRQRYGSALVNVVTRTTNRKVTINHKILTAFVSCESRITAAMDSLNADKAFTQALEPFRFKGHMDPNEARSLKVQLHNAQKRCDDLRRRNDELMQQDHIAEQNRLRHLLEASECMSGHVMASHNARMQEVMSFLINIMNVSGLDDERIPQDILDEISERNFTRPDYDTPNISQYRPKNECQVTIVDEDMNRAITLTWDRRVFISADTRMRSFAGYELFCAFVMWLVMHYDNVRTDDFVLDSIKTFVNSCNEDASLMSWGTDYLEKASLTVKSRKSMPKRQKSPYIIWRNCSVVAAFGFAISDLLAYPVYDGQLAEDPYTTHNIFSHARSMSYYVGARLMHDSGPWTAHIERDNERWHAACAAYRAYHENDTTKKIGLCA